MDSSSPGMAAFIVSVQQLLGQLRPLLSPANLDNVIAATTEAAGALIERAAMQCRFNRVCHVWWQFLLDSFAVCSHWQLGGLQFDRDVRALTSHLASLTQWSVRDRLARLAQLAVLLNLDKVQPVPSLSHCCCISFSSTLFHDHAHRTAGRHPRLLGRRHRMAVDTG